MNTIDTEYRLIKKKFKNVKGRNWAIGFPSRYSKETKAGSTCRV